MIEANFSGGKISVKTSSLWSFDTGRRLKISGIEGLNEDTEIHFRIISKKRAVVRKGVYNNADGSLVVNIPNEFLEFADSHLGKAWIYITDEFGEKTINEILIPVIGRKQPENYISQDDLSKDDVIQNAVNIYLDEHPVEGDFENVKNKKSAITNMSQEGDSDTNYPTVGAVRDFVNLVKDDLEDYVDDLIVTDTDYVKSEAERLSDVVRDRQGAGTITFISISDFHNNIGDKNIETGNKHALQAVKLLCERLKIDFVCGLGDYTWCAPRTNTTHDKGKSEIMAMVNGLINSASGKPMFLTTGNHDPLIDARHTEDSNGQYVYINPETDSTRLPIQAAEMFPLVEIYNCYNSKNSAGYGYKDFENYKLRVICLNTTDVTIPTTGAGYYNTNAVGMSTEQAQWFANSLDLTDKEDCAEWKTIVVSHFPLDWGGLIPLVKIIKAFEDGTSGSISFGGGTVTYDYNGKNAAQIAAQFHGHVHGFKVDNLHYFDDNSVLKTVETQRIAIPNACFYRTNEYGTNGATENNGIEFGVPADGTTYAKTANTANDTAFNVITLDFANRKIYADSYGAGYNREITIPEWSFVPVVIPDYMKTDYIPTATDDSGSILNGVGYIDGKRLSTSGKSSDYRDVARCTTSGYIPIEGGNTLHFGGSDCVWTSTSASNVWSYSYIYLYDENKTPIAYIVTDQGATTPAIPLDEFNYYSAEISPSAYTWKNSSGQTVNDLSGVRYCRVTVEGQGVNLRAYIE